MLKIWTRCTSFSSKVAVKNRRISTLFPLFKKDDNSPTNDNQDVDNRNIPIQKTYPLDKRNLKSSDYQQEQKQLMEKIDSCKIKLSTVKKREKWQKLQNSKQPEEKDVAVNAFAEQREKRDLKSPNSCMEEKPKSDAPAEEVYCQKCVQEETNPDEYCRKSENQKPQFGEEQESYCSKYETQNPQLEQKQENYCPVCETQKPQFAEQQQNACLESATEKQDYSPDCENSSTTPQIQLVSCLEETPKCGVYKNPEYFDYEQYTYYDLYNCSVGRRGRQPKSDCPQTNVQRQIQNYKTNKCCTTTTTTPSCSRCDKNV